MDIDYQVGEVELSYKSTVREKRKIATSSDAYGMLLSCLLYTSDAADE